MHSMANLCMLLAALLSGNSIQVEVRPTWSPRPGLERQVEFRFEQELENRGGSSASSYLQAKVGSEDLLREVHVRDRYLASCRGRASLLQRHYEEVEQTASPEGSPPHRDLWRTANCTGPLEGRSIEFRRSERGEEFVWAGPEGDPIWLAGLRGDMTFAGLLPPEPVAVGEAWPLDLEVLAELLAPGGEYWPFEACDDAPRSVLVLPPVTIPRAFGDFRGELKGCWQGTRVEEGVEVAVIRIELDVAATTTSSTAYEHPRIDYGSFLLERDLAGEGRLLWDLELGVLHSLHLDLDVEYALDAGWSGEWGTPFTRPMPIGSSERLAGRLRITAEGRDP